VKRHMNKKTEEETGNYFWLLAHKKGGGGISITRRREIPLREPKGESKPKVRAQDTSVLGEKEVSQREDANI